MAKSLIAPSEGRISNAGCENIALNWPAGDISRTLARDLLDARKSRDDALKHVRGLQDQIHKLERDVVQLHKLSGV
jgi:hypothetical protein